MNFVTNLNFIRHICRRRIKVMQDIEKIYEEYLGEAGGHKAHELLHTSYVKRNKYKLNEE